MLSHSHSLQSKLRAVWEQIPVEIRLPPRPDLSFTDAMGHLQIILYRKLLFSAGLARACDLAWPKRVPWGRFWNKNQSFERLHHASICFPWCFHQSARFHISGQQIERNVKG